VSVPYVSVSVDNIFICPVSSCQNFRFIFSIRFILVWSGRDDQERGAASTLASVLFQPKKKNETCPLCQQKISAEDDEKPKESLLDNFGPQDPSDQALAYTKRTSLESISESDIPTAVTGPERQVSFHEPEAATVAAESMRKDSTVLDGNDDPELEEQTHSSAYFTSLSIENQETEGGDLSVQEKHISVMGKQIDTTAEKDVAVPGEMSNRHSYADFQKFLFKASGLGKNVDINANAQS